MSRHPRPVRGWAALLLAGLCGTASANPGGLDWQPLGGLGGVSIARTETTIGQFRRFVQATGLVTAAERRGGGQVYAGGWVTRSGWTWRQPYGPALPVQDDEPAVHVTFDEAQAFCRWAGGRLPTDAEWLRAAYTEQRPQPPAPFVAGRSYTYPSGERPDGAQCLGDCGPAAAQRGVARAAGLDRGHGHARTRQTTPGVNGLHDMGGNVWEWVDEPPGPAAPTAERRTRGGSWWYGEGPMLADHQQGKPGDTAVVYIGFRCARVP